MLRLSSDLRDALNAARGARETEQEQIRRALAEWLADNPGETST